MKNLIFVFVAFFIVACGSGSSGIDNNLSSGVSNNSDSNSSTVTEINKSSRLNDVKIFFSQTDGNYSGGIDEKIVSDINSSKEFIDLAMYELTNRKIKDALIGAYNRGVEVRVITDDKSYDNKDYLFDELEDAGISVKSDESFSSGLMHDKFMVIDNKVLWSGSGNYTVYSFYRNYENYFRVTNSDIIANYKTEFDEMQKDSLKAQSYISNSYELYFSPEDDFRDKRLFSLVKDANNSVYIMAYALNDSELKDALIEAKDRGVDIHIIFDYKQTTGYQKDYTQYYTLKDAGIDAVLVGDSVHKMHNKVIIVDGSIVLTGSYNFTLTANDENCENELIIKNIEIAKKYLDDFKEVYRDRVED